MKMTTKYKKILGDIYTPVELYLKLRDKFPHSFLLESSDYNSKENSYSYLCLNPIASFIVDKQHTTITTLEKESKIKQTNLICINDELQSFIKSFTINKPKEIDFINNGIFGYTSYDSIPLFEDIQFENDTYELPLLQYHFFKYLIVFNHYKNELYIVEHLQDNEHSNIEQINDFINTKTISLFPFKITGKEETQTTDEGFLDLIAKGKEHCFRGDVFQLVLSRKFRQQFKGDEFNVYRALRSINPSPYLFYFDYGNFKIFGSSPEAQLVVKESKAYIYPIAGTFLRNGDTTIDAKIAKALEEDPKENAEHVMLVDLARNDLSRNSNEVKVERFKQIEYYSHVIHLVSKVSASITKDTNTIDIFTNTFPAGTLSGAPKHKAMQLIDKYEPESRGHYGGAIGILGLDGSINHAIFIRSILSYQNELTYQAGCGIVTKSDDRTELIEINNKLKAVRTAIQLAENI